MFYQLNIAFRNLRRGGIYSIINIGGLAIGMAAAILIMLWVYHQWSYDRFHKKENQLYSVWSRNMHYNHCVEWTPKILGPTMLEEHAEIKDMSRFMPKEQLLTYNEQKINMITGYVDQAFLTMFSFPLLHGDINTALKDPNSIVLTQEAAKRLFGDEDPMGKSLLLRAKHPYTVTGVMKDLPHNTRFNFNALLPFLSTKTIGEYDESWGWFSTATYVELQTTATEAEANAVVKDILKKHTDGKNEGEIFLHPITKWHLYSKDDNGKLVGGRIETLKLFTLIALLILLIACINFMNLTTAQSVKRAREVGVRKVLGARKNILIRQFLEESTLISVIAAVFAIIIVILCLPFFNSIMNVQIMLHFSHIGWWLSFIAFILFTGILAGSYPAFYLSSFLPVKILKGMSKKGNSVITPRKLLIVLQFSFAIVLIVSTLVVHRQIHHAQDRSVGYEQDQLITIPLSEKMNANINLIRDELLRTETAISVTRTLSPMTEIWNNGDMDWQGRNPGHTEIINRFYVDAGWSVTTGVTIVQGRDIDVYTYPTDSTAMLLTESTAKYMGFDDPIGQNIKDGYNWHVVGVVKDFIVQSPFDPIRPMVIGGPAGQFKILHVKLNGAHRMTDNLAKVEQVLKTYNPDYPFEYQFVDDRYAKKFAEEQRTGTLATWFAGLAVFISCLGLFGLSVYMAESRRKEIGVRKVLGASIINITSLLSREFLILVSISLLIAMPIAWWAMNKWLAGYAYRTDMPWWLFGLVALLTIGIALFTVSFQAVKAATTDPVKTIKAE